MKKQNPKIEVKEETKDALDELKIHNRQSYNEIIGQIISYYQKTKGEEQLLKQTAVPSNSKDVKEMEK